MMEGESGENHIVVSAKRGCESAESVAPAHERLFESTSCLEAPTRESDVRFCSCS